MAGFTASLYGCQPPNQLQCNVGAEGLIRKPAFIIACLRARRMMASVSARVSSCTSPSGLIRNLQGSLSDSALCFFVLVAIVLSPVHLAVIGFDTRLSGTRRSASRIGNLFERGANGIVQNFEA